MTRHLSRIGLVFLVSGLLACAGQSFDLTEPELESFDNIAGAAKPGGKGGGGGDKGVPATYEIEHLAIGNDGVELYVDGVDDVRASYSTAKAKPTPRYFLNVRDSSRGVFLDFSECAGPCNPPDLSATLGVVDQLNWMGALQGVDTGKSLEEMDPNGGQAVAGLLINFDVDGARHQLRFNAENEAGTNSLDVTRNGDTWTFTSQGDGIARLSKRVKRKTVGLGDFYMPTQFTLSKNP